MIQIKFLKTQFYKRTKTLLPFDITKKPASKYNTSPDKLQGFHGETKDYYDKKYFL